MAELAMSGRRCRLSSPQTDAARQQGAAVPFRADICTVEDSQFEHDYSLLDLQPVELAQWWSDCDVVEIDAANISGMTQSAVDEFR